MKPVKPLDANVVYLGPTPEIGDLECVRVKPGHIHSEWRLSEDETAWLVAGGNIKLEILTEPIPPVALNVVEPHCPECMVVMQLEERPDVQHHWHFICPTCRRWAA